MRKSIFAIAALVAMSMTACTVDEQTPAKADGTGALTVNFEVPQAVTRATAQGNEATLTDIQMLVFDSDGNLYKYHAFTSSEITAKTVTVDKVNYGTYSVYVIANGPSLSSVNTVSALKATEIALATYNGTASDFVMGGNADVTVNQPETTPATCAVAISRYVARVSVSQVTNNIPAAYGSLTVNYYVLNNVVSKQNLGGTYTAVAADFINQEGRKDETTRAAAHIIDGSTYTATTPDLTYASVGAAVANGSSYSTVKYFYGYPNASTTAPTGFNATFAPQRTVLTIAATFNGKKSYYPVVLDKVTGSTGAFDRNTTYDIKAVITGEGSDDPVVPAQKGAIKVTVTVSNWVDGSSYEVTF